MDRWVDVWRIEASPVRTDQLRKVGDDHIGTGGEQCVLPGPAVDTDGQSETTGASRGYAGGGVLDDDGYGIVDPELRGSEGVGVRGGFAWQLMLGGDEAIDDQLEALQ